MRENNNVIGWAMLIAMFVYSAVINAGLFFSMLMGFGFTLMIVMFIELSDRDMVENALEGNDIPPDLLNKVSGIFLLGIGTFVTLTTIIYNIITKLNI